MAIQKFVNHSMLKPVALLFLLFLPLLGYSASEAMDIDLTKSWAGIASIIIFVFAYALVICEETIHLRKSKPVMVAAGIIWFLVAIAYSQIGDTEQLEEMFGHNLLEFSELFLFLLAAMTYINTMEERGIFNLLRVWLVSQGFGLRKIFWITGLLAFCISPLADNLTTALLLSTVILTVAPDKPKFAAIACINIVVAANAGGAFSPFGDITTLMVWQYGALDFQQFFALVLPAIVNWIIPATIMSWSVPNIQPESMNETAKLEHGALVVVALFILTIVMAVLSHNLLGMPPVLGMMTGLGLLKIFGYYLQKRGEPNNEGHEYAGVDDGPGLTLEEANHQPYDMYRNLEKAEWDTLMFFYGIIMCVGGLGAFGYLAMGSELVYGGLGDTNANILVGVASAIVDNIPVMFAVLEMGPVMNEGQWLLVTLTAGVGGSMLSIGSAAGVAVMGQARGIYTFFEHLKWTWAIALGYAASIAVHMWINADKFQVM
ncbi:MAG: sodium:proton antiporter [SAR86 cluster bacterium]|uniref:Sodium:proton antiporter n=1 Tax=SAR86 cluster bacterium TaxID=2030880 RepID=A0A2A5CH21_9GAMM|nr:MAG: sodium:proton antiporter [SAR86 cluster bacterium]